jgi:hypothetical protein
MVKNEKDVARRFSWLVLGKFQNLPEEDRRLWYCKTRSLTHSKTISASFFGRNKAKLCEHFTVTLIVLYYTKSLHSLEAISRLTLRLGKIHS